MLSTPGDPGRALRAGLAELGGADPAASTPELLAHGTTVATNALLERRGGRVALVTTEGFADVIDGTVYTILLRYWAWTPEEDVRPFIYLMSD